MKFYFMFIYNKSHSERIKFISTEKSNRNTQKQIEKTKYFCLFVVKMKFIFVPQQAITTRYKQKKNKTKNDI